MRTLLWIVLALTALFAAMNWPAFNAPQPLWLGFATITAPLGVLMLGALTVIALLLLVEQSVALAESRRYARELDAQRKLAEKAEASRYSELRAYVNEEMGRAETRALDTRAVLVNRVDALERDLRTALEQAQTTIAAYIGELEDRAERRTHAASMSSPR
jgi:membrane protein implicated in regulation of membrane protease activity